MSKNNALIYFFLLMFLVVVVRFPSLELPLDNDSSEHAFIARQIIRGEVLYDKFHSGHHLPGIYYTFVLAFKLFGDNPISPKLLLLAVTSVSAWLLLLIGRQFYNNCTGILAAIFYILVSSQVLFSGTTAQMEHFANLPLIATMLLFLILLKKAAPIIPFIWIGLLGGISILYKAIFFGPLVTIVISICVWAWLERKRYDTQKILFLRLSLITIGFLIPLVFICGYYASHGLLQRLMLIFTLGGNYFFDTTHVYNLVFPKPFGLPLIVMAVNNTPLLLFGLIGTYRLIRNSMPMQTVENLKNFTLALWVIVSFASAGLRGGGYEHYALVVVPPLALTGGNIISCVYQHWRVVGLKKQALLGAGIMMATIITNFFWANYTLYQDYFSYKISQIFNGNSTIQFYPDDQQGIFDYIKTQTTSDDFIYVWSNNLMIYYYVDRVPPVDILMPYYVSATGSPERIFNPNTKYIIADSADVLPRPQWLNNGLTQYYLLETIIDGKDLYRRKN